MTDPPIGWMQHAYWHDLLLEVQAHRGSMAVAALFLLLLVGGRAALPASDRPRLRIALAAFVVYFISLPVRAYLLSAGLDGAYGGLRLTSVVALAWGIIGVGGLLVFDLLGKRLGVPKIFRDVTITIVSLVVLVVVLSRAGVNFLGIITTSAVLTAVIGLALQDTLGNLINGIAMQLESSIAIGDWIKVDDRAIGRVLEIRWRSTVIRTKNDDLIIIPNGVMTKGVITNFGKDGLENRRWVYFNVHLRYPPNQVQKIVKDALVGIANVSARTPPDCITWRFHESWLEYAVRYRLVDFLPDDSTDSEVRKRIWYALHRHNIEIPYPGHNLFITQLDAARTQTKSDVEMKHRLDALARVDFFAPLDDAERQHVAAGLVPRVYGAGEVLIRAGAEAHDLYLMCDGEATVKIDVDGLEKELATVRGGSFFGEMSLMTGAPRSATIVAKTDVHCYVLDRALFKTLLDQNPPLVEEVSRLLAERMVRLKAEREGLSAAAAAQAHEHDDLVDRIKKFFGLT